MPTSTSPSNTPYGKWDIGGCNCPVTSIQVNGCLAYPGLTVSVYTASGGTLLFSGTTDSGGLVYPGSLLPGTWYTTITGQSARFQAFASNHTYTSGPNSVGLLPSSGYYCVLGCLQPAAGTLHYTGPLGTYTLVNTGGSGYIWVDTITGTTVSFYGQTPGCPCLSEATLPNPTLTSATCPPGAVWNFSDGSVVSE